MLSNRIDHWLRVFWPSLFVAIAVAMSAAPAQAQQNGLIDSVDGPQVVRMMKNAGYAVELSDQDDEVIKWKLDGYNTLMLLMNEGTSLQFYAGFTMDNVSLRKLNDWNANRRYSRAYMDDDGDAAIELDLDLEGGVSEERILDFFKTSQISFGYWRQEVVND